MKAVSEDAQVRALFKTTFELKTSAIHLHHSVFEGLWCQEFENFVLVFVKKISVNTNDAHLTYHVRLVVGRQYKSNRVSKESSGNSKFGVSCQMS